MEFILERFIQGKGFTVGCLSIIKRDFDEYLGREDKEFICDTLEPPMRAFGINPNIRFHHKTALCAGRYPVVINFEERSKQFLPQILGMPKMMSKHVFLQTGNAVEDIHVGLIPGAYHGDGRMLDSQNMIYTIKQLIVESKKRGEAVFITVVNTLSKNY